MTTEPLKTLDKDQGFSLFCACPGPGLENVDKHQGFSRYFEPFLEPRKAGFGVIPKNFL